MAPVLLLALMLSGCTQAELASPMCDEGGRNTLVLIAQSVPEAQFVPCVEALPSGWSFTDVEIKSGHTQMIVDNMANASTSTVTVGLVAQCDIGDATEVPSDEREARRYEDVADVNNGYRGTSYYLFEGGCVTVDFNITGDRWSAQVNDASTAFSLFRRDTLEQYIRDYSKGVVTHL